MTCFSRQSVSRAIQIVGWPLLGLVFAARTIQSRRSLLLEFVDTWHLHLLAPSPLVLLLAAWARSPWLGLLGLLGGATALLSGRAAIGHAARNTSDSPARIRLLTANVLAKNRSAAGLAELIERTHPDIVTLQEIRDSYWSDLVERVGHLLPYTSVRTHKRFGGVALLSRWPLESAEAFRLVSSGHYCQRALLSVFGTQVHLFNIHLDTPFELYRRVSGFPRAGVRYRPNSARDDQVEELIELVSDLDEPTIVVGDFNSAAASHPHRRLLCRLRDAFQEVGRGLGLTYPQSTPSGGLPFASPLLRIDHAFFRGPVEPLTARVLPHPGSDHRALLVEFALTCQGQPGADARFVTRPA